MFGSKKEVEIIPKCDTIEEWLNVKTIFNGENLIILKMSAGQTSNDLDYHMIDVLLSQGYKFIIATTWPETRFFFNKPTQTTKSEPGSS